MKKQPPISTEHAQSVSRQQNNEHHHAHESHHAHDSGHAHHHEHTHGEHSPHHGHQENHSHAHTHDHNHPHTHCHVNQHAEHTPTAQRELQPFAGKTVLTIRSFSGLSGDMMLAGMARMCGCSQEELDALTAALNVEKALNCVQLVPHSVNHIAGWHCKVTIPHEHVHRTLNDILKIIDASQLSENARALSATTFTLLAEAEGAVHGIAPEKVCFHEVGALDSIIDICLVCALFDRIDPAHFRCSPLPVADGGVVCAHGPIPTPAPATFMLLQGMQVCSFHGKGETVTPTAAALLKALGAHFGPWPAMTVERNALVYGTKVFPQVANGTLWAMGTAL